MICQYCNNQAKLVKGNVIYNSAFKTIGDKWFWYCKPCVAWVGCHPDTDKPLGTLAKSRLRMLRHEAHEYFDRLWKDHNHTRNEAYTWLADTLEIEKPNCHIALFNERQCIKTINLARKELKLLCQNC